MEDVLSKMVKRGIPLPRAFPQLRRGFRESAELWESEADHKRKLFAGRIDEVTAREIDVLDALAKEVYQLEADIQKLENMRWRPTT